MIDTLGDGDMLMAGDCCVDRMNGRDYRYAQSLKTAQGSPKSGPVLTMVK